MTKFRKFALALCLVLILALAFMLCACKEEECEHSLTILSEVAPTCTESGLTEGKKCTVCGEILAEQKVIPAKGHLFENNYDCTRCDYSATPSEGLTYILSKDKTYYSVTGIGTCKDTALVIPSTYNGLSVSVVEQKAFDRLSYLTSVIIPDSVTSIEEEAFYHCYSLTNIYLSNGIISIGEKAFAGCDLITNVNIPNSVCLIRDYAFLSCDLLTSVTLGDKVVSIGEGVFYGCKSLTDINIPNSVTSIGYCAFERCSSLKYNEYDNAHYLGNDTNPYLALITAKNKNITTCLINENTKIIVGNAFYGCQSLTDINIPNSVTSIGNYAFVGCSKLATINVPYSASSIGLLAFSDCDDILVDKNNAVYKSINGNLYSKDGKTLIQYAEGETDDTHFVIPNSVTVIGKSAFSGCKSLNMITIGESVDSIEDSAFFGCESLTSMVIPYGVASIGNSAFSDCKSLAYISIPNSVTSIGDSAFSDCESLAKIIIPNSVTIIRREAFSDCSSLTIYCEADSQPNGWASSWNYSSCPVEWGYVKP